jgi:hypothetical protein
MNLQSVFEELNKLYEFVEEPMEKQYEVTDDLTEAADEEIEIVDDEPAEEAIDEGELDKEQPEEIELVLECSKCGGLMIKAKADVEVAEESDLANVDEVCQYCEEAAGFIIKGMLVSYEAAEGEPVIEESLNKVTEDFSKFVWVVYDEHGDFVGSYPEDKEAEARKKAKEFHKATVKKADINDDFDELTEDFSKYVWVVYNKRGEFVCSYPENKEDEARKKAKELPNATVKKAQVNDDFNESIQEGIFDSKATKEKNYKEVIKDVFKKDVTPLVFEISNNVTQLLHDATDGAKSTAEFAKNLQTMLKAIETAIKQRGAVNVLNTVINFGRKYAYESLYLEELTEQVKLMHKVKNTPKVGGKAYEYMHEKLAAEILKNLKNYQKHLSKEFG